VFTKLLVPLDGSVESVAALPLARAMLGTSAAELVLVRVVDSATSAHFDSSDAAHECESYLNQVAGEFHGGTNRVTTCVLFGSPGQAIVHTVSSLGADLVVMATHGRGELGRLLFGSTAECVVGHSPVPVLVVRPGGRQVTHVQTLLVPLDGSPGGRRALAAATRLARQHGARLELLTVIQGMPGYLKKPLPGVDLGPVIAPAWNSARQEAADVLQGTAERLGRHGIQASARAVIGDPPPRNCPRRRTDRSRPGGDEHPRAGRARAQSARQRRRVRCPRGWAAGAAGAALCSLTSWIDGDATGAAWRRRVACVGDLSLTRARPDV
jgi:nucleotide-binding universal stress UspA family protein